MLLLKELSTERLSTSFCVISTIFYLKYMLEYTDPDPSGPIERYGLTFAIVFYVLKLFFVIVSFLFTLLNYSTCMFAEPPDTIKPKVRAPANKTVCFRVVTRGTYPKLVKDNVEYNLAVLKPYDSTLRYTYEVVTDIPINIDNKKSSSSTTKCYEVVVPADYRTKNNTKYKARALHYAIEANVSRLEDEDFVVHLDEESLLTKSCVDGVLRFANENKHQIGQGRRFFFLHDFEIVITSKPRIEPLGD